MKAKVSWTGGNFYLAESGTGHTVVMGTRPAPDVLPLAPTPMELVLIGAGGCTAIDIVHILRRGRHDVRGCEVELDADRAETDPKVFTRIHYRFTISGRGLTEEVVERAIRLSKEKYCSASIMLEKTAPITHEFEIREIKETN